MIPISSIEINSTFTTIRQPSLSYKMDIQNECVQDYIDNIEAVKQTIYKILMTKRYMYEIYNWNYGIEIDDLIGKPKELVCAVLPERIQDALKIDDRVNYVYDFEFFDIDKTSLSVQFYVNTIFGSEKFEWEMNNIV